MTIISKILLILFLIFNYLPAQFGQILKYVNEYVVCSSCMNTNTTLIKDKDTKKFRFTCSCGFFKYI